MLCQNDAVSDLANGALVRAPYRLGAAREPHDVNSRTDLHSNSNAAPSSNKTLFLTWSRVRTPLASFQVRIIEQESSVYSDSVTQFVQALYVDYDFER